MVAKRANARRGRVFISFKSGEIDIARRLKQALEDHGFEIWWQEQIQCGEEWHGAIDEAILAAGCIVVLWSSTSMLSPWVKHEASQAIARKVYAPARIELVEITPPFNRQQATDLISWADDRNHPGLLDLIARIARLIPLPLPWPVVLGRALLRARATIVASAVAAVALAVLASLTRNVLSLSRRTEDLVIRQEVIAKDVERAMHPLNEVEVTLFLEVDRDSPEMKAYHDRIQTALLPEHLARAFAAGDVAPAMQDRNGTVLQVQLLSGSRLLPRYPADLVAGYTLQYLDLELQLRHAGPDVATAPNALSIPLAIGPSSARQPSVSVDLRDMTIHLLAHFRPERATWHGNGTIASVDDLLLSRFVVNVRSIMAPSTAQKDELRSSRSALRVTSLVLRAGGREFWARQAALHELSAPHQLRSYGGSFTETTNR
jgi:hypothetical protein